MAFESTNTPTLKASFMAAISSLVPAAATTDFFTISGVNGKRVIVNRISFSGIATSASAVPLLLIKRSTLNSGGTSTPLPAVNVDSANTTPGLAPVLAYTANPAALGSTAGGGTLSAQRVIISTASASVGSAPQEFNLERMFHRPIVLNNANEVLSMNLGSATITGGLLDLMIAWTEEQ